VDTAAHTAAGLKQKTIYDPFVGGSDSPRSSEPHGGSNVMHATARTPAPTAPASELSRSAAKPIPSPAALAAWEAEDGRCEACGRPMDKSCAHSGRDKHGEHRLVCPDCKDRRPDPLTAAVAAPKTTVRLAER
jgi:hypothetical protein